MKYLFIKTWRDILKNWLQFLAVFIMAALSVAIYSGMEGMWHGLNLVVQDYYEETNIADAWIYSQDASGEAVAELQKLDYVSDASKSMSFSVLLADDGDTGEASNVKLRTLTEADAISVPLLQEGNPLTYASADSIWLDASFADAHHIKPGDKVEFIFNSVPKELVVAGLVLNSEYIYYTGSTTAIVPNHDLYGYGYLSEAAAQELVGPLIYNEIRLKLKSEYSHDQLRADAQSILGGSYLDTIVKDDVPAVSQITKEIAQMKVMAQMFSFVFILLALLTMYTTMSRLINTQTVCIGLLKALGYSDWMLRLHYSLYGLAVALTGGLLGSLLGPLIVSPAVMRVKKATLTLPQWEIQTSVMTYLIIALIVLICTVSCLFAAQKGLKELPAVTMRGAAPKSGAKSLLESASFIWNRLSAEWRWIFRDMSRFKARSLMGIIGVVGGFMLIIAGFGFKDSIQYSNNYVYGTQYQYNEKLLVRNLAAADKLEIEDMSDRQQWIMEASAEISSHDARKKGLLTVLEDGELFSFENVNQHSITLPAEGALISHKLARKLNIEQGDAIGIHVIGTRLDFSIRAADIIYSPAPQGIFISRAYYESLGNTFFPTAALTARGDTELSYYSVPSVQEVTTIEYQEKDMDIMSRSVMTIIRLLIIASILLSVVILYNLGALNYVERYREYATMKVLGFYQWEIRALMLRECFFTTLVGWVIGIPVGIWFLKKYIGIVAFDSFEWIPHITPISFIICSCIIILCSVAVTLILSRRMERINMVEALKSVE